MILRLFFASFASMFLTTAAVGQASESQLVQLRKEEPVTLNPSKAYFLIRAPIVKNSIFLLREPSDSEIAQYETAKRAEYDRKQRDTPYEQFVFDWKGAANFYELRVTKHYSRPQKDLRIVLAEAPPGEYVLYGIGYKGFLYQCHCMGTVGFTAEAGKITDLGTSLISPAWEPSPHPELKDETNLGRVARMDFGLFAATIRPATGDEIIPTQIQAKTVEPANYQAVGPWLDPRRTLANRLGAIPGVLEYREGIAFDPTTEQLLRLPIRP